MGFIGKLAKMAAGVKQTHVKGSKVDMKFLSELAENCGANEIIIEKILKANTARHVSEIIKENKIIGFFEQICEKTYKQMKKHSEEKISLDVILFDFEGNILAKKS